MVISLNVVTLLMGAGCHSQRNRILQSSKAPPAATSQNYLPIEVSLHGTSPPPLPPFPTYRPYNEFK